MVVKIKVDATDLLNVANKAEKTSRSIDQSVTPAVNRSGRRMRRNVASQIAKAFTRSISESLGAVGEFQGNEKINVRIPVNDILEWLVPSEGMSASSPSYELYVRQNFPYFYWATQADEMVCEICGPRQGMILHEDALEEYFPAHANCRCQVVRVDLGSLVSLFADDASNVASQEVVDDTLRLFLREWA